jgi:predicted dehydrogenase
LIGLGFIGKVHLAAYQAIPLCYDPPAAIPRVTTLLRSLPGTEAAAAQITAIPTITADPDLFFDQPLDLVDICSPNDAHLEYARRALDRGLPVYCEKPLANTLVDARQMAELAGRSGVLNQVALVNRFVPAIRQMKALLETGAIGEPILFHARKLHSSYLDPQRPVSWRLQHARSGGGALMDLGIHAVDLVRYVLGEFAAVRAVARTIVPARPAARGSEQTLPVDVDDWTLCTVELTNGCTGTIEASRVSAGDDETSTFTVYGSRGALAYTEKEPDAVAWYDLEAKQWKQGGVALLAPAGERATGAFWPPRKLSQGSMTDRHMASIVDLLLNWADGRYSPVDFQAGLRAQEVVEACYLSASSAGERITFPLS